MSEKSIADLLAEAREVYGVFGRAPQALTIVDKALAQEPKSVEALNLKAAILYELDRDDEARMYHEQALAIEPCSVEALHGLTALANDAGEYEQALAMAARGFACIPNDPHPEFRENEDYRQRLIAELYNEKAFALWYTGNREEAIRLLTEEGPSACPMEMETLEDQLEWLEEHQASPEV